MLFPPSLTWNFRSLGRSGTRRCGELPRGGFSTVISPMVTEISSASIIFMKNLHDTSNCRRRGCHWMAALSIFAPVAMVDVIDLHYLLAEPPMPTASYWPSTIHSTPTSNIQQQKQKKQKMIFLLHGRPTPRNGALLGVTTDRSNGEIDSTTVRRQGKHRQAKRSSGAKWRNSGTKWREGKTRHSRDTLDTRPPTSRP